MLGSPEVDDGMTMEPSKPNVRKTFFSKLRTDFFVYLKSYPLLKEWGFTEIMQLTDSVIDAKRPEIVALLDEKKFTLKDVDQVTRLIISEYLAPEIEKIRI